MLSGLTWSEGPTTAGLDKVYIEDSFAELSSTENPWPSIVMSIGGAQLGVLSIGNSLTSQSFTDRTKGLETTTNISLEITGRNKAETFRISEAVATLLYLFSPEIKQYAVDVEDIIGITVGAVSPQNQLGTAGDQILCFVSTVSFSVRYKLEFKLTQVAMPFTMAVFGQRAEDSIIEGAEMIFETVQIPESDYGLTNIPEPEAPLTISGQPETTLYVGESYLFTPTVVNPSSRSVAFKIENKPYWATFDSATGTLSGTPPSTAQGNFTGITIGASNNNRDYVWLEHFSVLVTKLPVITGTPPTTGTVGNLYEFVPTMYDPNGLSVTAEIENQPAWASFDASTGRLYGTPVAVGVYPSIRLAVVNAMGQRAYLPTFSIGVS